MVIKPISGEIIINLTDEASVHVLGDNYVDQIHSELDTSTCDLHL